MEQSQQAINSERAMKVSASDMPLHCPMEEENAWAMHPRVFLAIKREDGATIQCPYCGALYVFST